MTAPGRNAHTLEQKQFIVRKLAAFEPPRAIVAAFTAVYRDTRCDENDVLALDQKSGALLSPDLFSLFLSERERIMLDPTAAPFADQRARLIVLSRQAERYENNNQPAEARAVFRQIAEEMGLVGGKGASKASAPGKDAEPIDEIRVTYVDPVPAA